MKNYLPTKKQWKSWSLPSKLTAIGALVGIAGLVLTVMSMLSNYSVEAPIVEPRPYFEGVWNDEKAFKVAVPAPRMPEYSDAHGDRLERSFFISLQGDDVRILLTSISEGGCQACQLVLSLFVFIKEGDRWILSNESRDFMKAGRKLFNDVNDIVEVWHIGPNRFGIVFTTEGWNQGDTFISKKIYSFIAGELTVVLDGKFQTYFSGLDKEDAIKFGYWFEKGAMLEIDPSMSNFGFFNIKATYFSSKAEKELVSYIKFNGSNYPVPSLPDLLKCSGGIEGFINRGKCT